MKSHVMEAYAFPAATPVRRGYVDGKDRQVRQSPESRRASMAQQGAVAAGEHGCQPVSAPAQATMADCVNASMQVEQPAGPQSTLDRLLAEAELAQLRSRHYTVLPRGKPGQRSFPLGSFRAAWSLERVSFGFHWNPKLREAGFRPLYVG
jgi:hypothetical protein